MVLEKLPAVSVLFLFASSQKFSMLPFLNKIVCYIAQLVCALGLVSLVGRTVVYGPLNSKVCLVSGQAKCLFEPRDFFRSDLWPACFKLQVLMVRDSK